MAKFKKVTHHLKTPCVGELHATLVLVHAEAPLLEVSEGGQELPGSLGRGLVEEVGEGTDPADLLLVAVQVLEEGATLILVPRNEFKRQLRNTYTTYSSNNSSVISRNQLVFTSHT